MINHILLFKFNEDVDEKAKGEAFDRLERLGELCPTIGTWVVGRNVAKSASAYDMVEIATFATQEDFEAYKTHPSHQAFAEYISNLATWALVDFDSITPALPEEHGYL